MTYTASESQMSEDTRRTLPPLVNSILLSNIICRIGRHINDVSSFRDVLEIGNLTFDVVVRVKYLSFILNIYINVVQLNF